MAKVEVLYPFGGAHRGDVVEVPDDKVGALRRLKWAREIVEPSPVERPAAAPRPRKVRGQEKESDIAVLSEETEARFSG